MTIRETFDQHYVVDAVTQCWNWQRRKNGVGYGLIYISGNHRLKNVIEQLAHRFSYERKHGRIPDGLFACHRCDNPSCVNPDHIFLGTNRENMNDCKRKGRNRFIAHPGENNGRAKISIADVNAIRAMEGSMSQIKIGKQFGISERQVGRILHREQWAIQAGN